MSEAAALDAVMSDAALALQLFVRNPSLFGGIVLRGDGPVRDEMVAFAKEAIGQFGPVAKIPSNVDTERLLGGLDLTATLATGQSVLRAGLLGSAAVIVPMAERVQANVAAHIAQAMDGGDVAAILLDDSQEPDEAPPAVLTERMAFYCDVSALRSYGGGAATKPLMLSTVEPLGDEQLHAIAATSAALGIGSVRALIFANSAARAHAAHNGRTQAIDEDIAAAVRLVLSPRATQMPQMEPPPPEPEDRQPQDSEPDDKEEDRNIEDIDLEDIMLDAAAAAIPKHILDQIDGAAKRGGKGQGGKSGQKQKSAMRGRPLGSRPGVPGNGKRLSLIDSLRAAAPWQNIRRQLARADDSRIIHIRKSDLRVRHYEQRTESLTIFAVDASGSSALSRLAEAKGAVEMMLAQAYVKRSQVALIAFRQSAAEILLPPTRSLNSGKAGISGVTRRRRHAVGCWPAGRTAIGRSRPARRTNSNHCNPHRRQGQCRNGRHRKPRGRNGGSASGRAQYSGARAELHRHRHIAAPTRGSRRTGRRAKRSLSATTPSAKRGNGRGD